MPQFQLEKRNTGTELLLRHRAALVRYAVQLGESPARRLAEASAASSASTSAVTLAAAASLAGGVVAEAGEPALRVEERPGHHSEVERDASAR